MTDKDDMIRRNIMDGDPFLNEAPSWRFKSPETEPYMPSQAPGECRGQQGDEACNCCMSHALPWCTGMCATKQ